MLWGLAAILPATTVASAQIPAGYDLLETDSSETYQDLDLPAGFLEPYCDVGFTGRVPLKGVPFDCFQSTCDLHPTDTIVQRLAAADLAVSTIPIRIVRLELTSVTPFTVDCSGGPQDWNMDASVPEGDPNQTDGSMTISQSYPNGGTFTATLPVTPTVTFRRVSDGATVGPMLAETITFDVGTMSPVGEWCNAANPLDLPAGHYVVSFNDSTNFFPGIVCPDSPGGGGQRQKKLTEEQAAQAKHGIKPAEKKNHYKCYEITGPALDEDATLDNEFGSETVTVGAPRFLCPPALKNGEGDPESPHLKCYDITGSDPEAIVDLKTQFGIEPRVAIGQAKLLCVPVLKEVLSPIPEPPPPGPPPLTPHYTCYAIGGPSPNVTVELSTQFGLEPAVDVLAPSYKCVPSVKNGEGNLKQPDLKCYDILGNDPPHVVNLETQFGIEEDVQVDQAKLLCIPTRELPCATCPPPTLVPAVPPWGLAALATLLVAGAFVALRFRG